MLTKDPVSIGFDLGSLGILKPSLRSPEVPSSGGLLDEFAVELQVGLKSSTKQRSNRSKAMVRWCRCSFLWLGILNRWFCVFFMVQILWERPSGHAGDAREKRSLCVVFF